ncbi:hypothetical protein MEL_008 [Melbournevirus]|uniref:hypothetical protein n=1 Tax=Melbournevirus TaxID=1560514 RepID=UPI00051F534A|nr:hypothetical protein MEL_008 [Melbournevirus]AIT54621.1 hypothetical protein MEL_008 [Melbournevirus]
MGNKNSALSVSYSGISFSSFSNGRREFEAAEFEKWAHRPKPDGLGVQQTKTGKSLAKKVTKLCCGMTNQEILFVSGRYLLSQK